MSSPNGANLPRGLYLYLNGRKGLCIALKKLLEVGDEGLTSNDIYSLSEYPVNISMIRKLMYSEIICSTRKDKKHCVRLVISDRWADSVKQYLSLEGYYG